MFCITVLLASCMQYAISFVLLLVQDMRQIFLIKFMNILAARKQIISPTAAHIKGYLFFFFLIESFYIEQHAWSWFWKDCMTLQRYYTFSLSIYLFYALTVQNFLLLLFHYGLNKYSKLWINTETHFFKEIKLHNFRHGLTLQLPDKDFSTFCAV